jgi:hypothetical protein
LLNLAPIREKGRVLAARILAAAQAERVRAGDRGCTDRALVRYWQLRSHAQVAAFFRPTSGKAMYFGDVLALPRELARDVLVRALAALDEPSATPGPEESIYQLVIEIGEAVKALTTDLAGGGRIHNHARHAASFARVAAVALRGQQAAERLAEGDVR